MPRTGGIYSAPAGTKGIPNTTVASNPYNSFIDDLVQDANAARPITAGGTGATTATAARTNLGAIGAADILAAPTKAVPVDGDGVVITDSQAAGALKRVLMSFFTSAANLSSGTIPDARLPERIGPRLDTAFTNANLAVDSGWYFMGSSATNTPVAESGFLLNLRQVTDYAKQFFYTRDGLSQYVRAQIAGAWGGWFRLFSTEIELDARYLSTTVGGTSKAAVLADRLYIGDSTAAFIGKYTTLTAIQNLFQTAFDIRYQADLGFTPVRQGGGTAQLTNIVRIGWSASAQLRVQIDNTDFGTTWPINISGQAGNASTVQGSTVANILTSADARVPGVIAGATIGDIGSYALLVRDDGQPALAPGNGAAGSTLSYATANGNVGIPTRPSGTWRCMGRTAASSTDAQRTSLFLRIS